MNAFDVLTSADFATWESARAMARGVFGVELGGACNWVTLCVRGVEIHYDVAGDFAYCNASHYDRFGTDMENWEKEEDRVIKYGEFFSNK